MTEQTVKFRLTVRVVDPDDHWHIAQAVGEWGQDPNFSGATYALGASVGASRALELVELLAALRAEWNATRPAGEPLVMVEREGWFAVVLVETCPKPAE